MANACYNPNDHYLPASFKGVPFEALEVSSQHGRRGAEGEFPWGEESSYVDLGRSIRSYRISGRFSNNSHVAMAQLLILAVETPGPGILVHPTRGIIYAACKSLTVNDNREENAGVTTFDAEFVDGNSLGSGIGLIQTIGNVAITALMAVNNGSFSSRYKPSQARFYTTPTIVSTTAQGVDAIAASYTQASEGASNEANDQRWAIISDFESIKNDNYVLENSENAALIVQNGLNYIDRDARDSLAKVNAYRKIVNWASQSPWLPQEAGLMQNAVFTLFRVSAAAMLAKAMMETNPRNLSEALRDYDRVALVLDEEMAAANDACHDPILFRELGNFAAIAKKALIDRAYKSPALVEYKFPSSTHSLVAAFEIFNDAKKFKEIEQSNYGEPWNIGPNIIAAKK